MLRAFRRCPKFGVWSQPKKTEHFPIKLTKPGKRLAELQGEEKLGLENRTPRDLVWVPKGEKIEYCIKKAE